MAFGKEKSSWRFTSNVSLVQLLKKGGSNYLESMIGGYKDLDINMTSQGTGSSIKLEATTGEKTEADWITISNAIKSKFKREFNEEIEVI